MEEEEKEHMIALYLVREHTGQGNMLEDMVQRMARTRPLSEMAHDILELVRRLDNI